MDPIARKMEQLDTISSPQPPDLEQAYQLFSLVIERMTENDNVGFTTLFSRIAYLSTQNDLPGKLVFDCQLFRRIIESDSYKPTDITSLIQLSLYLIQELTQQVHKYKWNRNYEKPDHAFQKQEKESLEYLRIVKAAIIAIAEKELIVLIDEDPEQQRKVKITIS